MTRILQARSTISLFAAGFALLLGCANAVDAASVSEYTRRISRAITLVREIENAYGPDSLYTPQGLIETNLPRVRSELPASERVDISGGAITVDNSWLYQLLTDVEKSNDQNNRRALLARTVERLRALHERLDEAQKASGVNSDKDAEKGRLAEILRRPEYAPVPPSERSSAIQRLLERLINWIDSLFPKRKPLAPSTSSTLSAIAQVLVVGACLAVIGFLIWRYGPRFMQGRRKKKKTREPRIVLGEVLEPDQTAADLLAQADALARKGDLRAAIRKAYIALLCELGDRKLISLAQYKTNRDYLSSVRDKVSLYTSMRKLTNSFELHWYGLVPAGESEWNEFRNDYHRTLKIPTTLE